MRTLSVKGFAAIDDEFKARRNALLERRLRTEMKIVPPGMSSSDLQNLIAPVIKDARLLGFAEDENDLLRFVALAFLPNIVREHAYLGANMQRCLGNENLHPTDRLDFLYRQIMPKIKRVLETEANTV